MSTKMTFQPWLAKLAGYWRHHQRRWVVLLLWIAAIWLYWQSTAQVAPTIADKVRLLAGLFLIEGWGPLLFILVYTVQPLVFFPSFVMTIAAGILYGPLWGLIFSVLGGNAAASLSYTVGRLLGADIFGDILSNRRMEGYIHRLRTNTFETILVLNLLHAPFDLVNYLAGVLRLRWIQFAAATAIGIVPGGLPFALFGGSLGTIDELTSGRPNINYPLLALSVAIGILAMLLSRLIRRRQPEVVKE